MVMLPLDKTTAGGEGGNLVPQNVMRIKYGDYSFSYNSIGLETTYNYNPDGLQLISEDYVFTIEGYDGNTGGAYSASSLVSRFSTDQENIRQILSTQGLQLTISMSGPGGDNLFDFTQSKKPKPTGDGVSVQNYDVFYGPKPQSLKFDKGDIFGGQLIKFIWIVKVTVKPRASKFDTKNTKGILSFEFKESQELDVNFMMTRKISGKIIAMKGYNVDSDEFRVYATPNAKKGFKRIASSYEINQTGSVATFSFTDKEVYRHLLFPATDGEATFSINRTISKVYLTLQGNFSAPSVDGKKAEIFNILAMLVTAKFPGTKEQFILKNAQVDDSMFTNKISFNFSGWFALEIKLKNKNTFHQPVFQTINFGKEAMSDGATDTDKKSGMAVSSTYYHTRGTADIKSVTWEGDYAPERYNEAYVPAPGEFKLDDDIERPERIKDDAERPERIKDDAEKLNKLLEKKDTTVRVLRY